MVESFQILGIAIFVLILFISVAFHETMHALVAYRLGDDLAHSHGRISLNPLKHIDPMLTLVLPSVMLLLGLPPILAAKPVPINTSRISGEEMGLAAVGFAGPLTNLVLASVVAVFLNFFVTDAGLLRDITILAIRINIGLFVFNMLPIPPLDGSRILYAFAPLKVQAVMEQIEQFGIFVIIILITVLLPVLSPILISANEFFLNILIR